MDMTRHCGPTGFATVDGQLAIGGIPLTRLAARVGVGGERRVRTAAGEQEGDHSGSSNAANLLGWWKSGFGPGNGTLDR